LFYSQTEAEKIVAMLRDIPERSTCRYEIVEAVRHVLAQRTPDPVQRRRKEIDS
jgi:hypothetical protein